LLLKLVSFGAQKKKKKKKKKGREREETETNNPIAGHNRQETRERTANKISLHKEKKKKKKTTTKTNNKQTNTRKSNSNNYQINPLTFLKVYRNSQICDSRKKKPCLHFFFLLLFFSFFSTTMIFPRLKLSVPNHHGWLNAFYNSCNVFISFLKWKLQSSQKSWFFFRVISNETLRKLNIICTIHQIKSCKPQNPSNFLFISSNSENLQLVEISDGNKVCRSRRPAERVNLSFSFVSENNDEVQKTKKKKKKKKKTVFSAYERMGSVIFFGRGDRSQMSVLLSSPAVTKWLLLCGAHATPDTAAVCPANSQNHQKQTRQNATFSFFFTLQYTARCARMSCVNHDCFRSLHANRREIVSVLCFCFDVSDRVNETCCAVNTHQFVPTNAQQRLRMSSFEQNGRMLQRSKIKHAQRSICTNTRKLVRT
jgi:hypothetical protein